MIFGVARSARIPAPRSAMNTKSAASGTDQMVRQATISKTCAPDRSAALNSRGRNPHMV